MSKIAFIGDSNTATRPGNGIYQADTFSQKIANARGFTSVVNAGVGGNTTAQMLARFSTDVLATNPDHVVISPGINDYAGGVSLATMEANIDSMVTAALGHGCGVTLFVPPLVCSTPFIENIPPYNDVIKKVASDNSVPCVDLYFEFMQVYFTTLNKNPALFNGLYVDYQHVSALGHTFVRDAVIKAANWRACAL